MAERLNKSLLYTFGVGDLFFTLLINMELYFFPAFLTDYAQFSLVVVGQILYITSIADIVCALVAGVILPVLVILALVAIPYFRVNVKLKGLWKENQRATLLLLLGVAAVLTIVLLLYRVYAMLVPTIVVAGCMLLPYFIRKETGFIGWLGSRPLTWWIMTWFVIIVVVLTAIGTLFRGPEWSWTWPWREIY